MPTISATSSASPSLQASLNSARLQQARQEADQAERTAQDLRSQADQAETEAAKGQEKVRQLVSASQTSDPTYTAGTSKQQSEVSPKTQDFLLRMYTATSQKFADSGNALKTNPDAAPVVNTRGQSTGRIVNIKA